MVITFGIDKSFRFGEFSITGPRRFQFFEFTKHFIPIGDGRYKTQWFLATPVGSIYVEKR